MLVSMEEKMAFHLITQLNSDFNFNKIDWEGHDKHAYYFKALDENGVSIELKITKPSHDYSFKELWYKYGEDWYFADNLN